MIPAWVTPEVVGYVLIIVAAFLLGRSFGHGGGDEDAHSLRQTNYVEEVDHVYMGDRLVRTVTTHRSTAP